jgi:hypothetical protein
MSAATQASLPSRVAVRWYQVAVMVLGLALAAVTALAIYLAVRDSSPTPIPAGSTGTVAEQPCYRPQVPC